MITLRLPYLGFLAALPLLAACTQTANVPAAPAIDPALLSSDARAALEDVERTQERHKEQATNMAVASFFDPIGITALARPAMEAEQRREMDEKYKRVEEELRKTIAEAEAVKAQKQARGRSSGSRKRERTEPAAQEAQAE